MLKLDNQFKDDYFRFYKELSPFEVVAEIKECLNKQPGYAVVNALNLVKTCATLGHSYMECCMEMANRKSFVLDDDPEKKMFNLAFIHQYEADPTALESFLGIRFTVRDIYAEIAKEAYGHSDEKALEKIKNIETPHSYSVQDPYPVSRDQWFYNMTLAVGAYAKCHSRKIGAVLVRDKSVISTGYNGPPRGVPTCDQRWVVDKVFKEKYGKAAEGKETKGVCPRRVIGFPSGEGLGICPAGHAERNALINAAKLGIKTNNTKLYMSCGLPCTPCMVEIINAGVEEIICTKVYPAYDETAMYLLENSDLKIRLYDFLV
jgi:dCMP deaminase